MLKPSDTEATGTLPIRVVGVTAEVVTRYSFVGLVRLLDPPALLSAADPPLEERPVPVVGAGGGAGGGGVGDFDSSVSIDCSCGARRLPKEHRNFQYIVQVELTEAIT